MLNEDQINKSLLDAMLASIENHERLCTIKSEKRSMAYKFKYIIWYIMLIFLSPHKKIISGKMVCAITPVNKTRLVPYMDNDEYFAFAHLNNTLSKVRKNISVLSPYSIKNRIAVTFRAVSFYFRFHKQLRGYFHFTLEYYSIAKYIDEYSVKKIIYPGMYDRYCTFLSYYAHSKGIELIGVQDGAAVDINVPRKLFCNEMNCFDEFEGRIIKRFIANDDCKFIYTGFTSTLKWEEFENNGKYTIAIAGQDWFTNKTLALIDDLMQKVKDKKINVMVFPHYRESKELYTDIKNKYPKLIVKTGNRYSNIDLLVTFYSTIVYDFWSVNPDLEVKCLRIPGYEPAYYERDNVYVYNDINALVEDICELATNKNGNKCKWLEGVGT